MSPDCFNQCPECDLILSARSNKAEISCPKCLMAGSEIAMRLVPIQGRSTHYNTRLGRSPRLA